MPRQDGWTDEDQAIAEQVLRNLRRIIRRVSEHSKDLSRDVGLTLPQLMCLKGIGRAEDQELTVAMLADAIQLSPPTVSRIVDRLRKDGLVDRERRSDDRRKVCLNLTTAGLERYRTLPVVLQERFHDRLMALGRDERGDLLFALQRISDMMDATDLDAAPLLAPGSEV